MKALIVGKRETLVPDLTGLADWVRQARVAPMASLGSARMRSQRLDVRTVQAVILLNPSMMMNAKAPDAIYQSAAMPSTLGGKAKGRLWSG